MASSRGGCCCHAARPSVCQSIVALIKIVDRRQQEKASSFAFSDDIPRVQSPTTAWLLQFDPGGRCGWPPPPFKEGGIQRCKHCLLLHLATPGFKAMLENPTLELAAFRLLCGEWIIFMAWHGRAKRPGGPIINLILLPDRPERLSEWQPFSAEKRRPPLEIWHRYWNSLYDSLQPTHSAFM